MWKKCQASNHVSAVSVQPSKQTMTEWKNVVEPGHQGLCTVEGHVAFYLESAGGKCVHLYLIVMKISQTFPLYYMQVQYPASLGGKSIIAFP